MPLPEAVAKTVVAEALAERAVQELEVAAAGADDDEISEIPQIDLPAGEAPFPGSFPRNIFYGDDVAGGKLDEAERPMDASGHEALRIATAAAEELVSAMEAEQARPRTPPPTPPPNTPPLIHPPCIPPYSPYI